MTFVVFMLNWLLGFLRVPKYNIGVTVGGCIFELSEICAVGRLPELLESQGFVLAKEEVTNEERNVEQGLELGVKAKSEGVNRLFNRG